MHNTLAMQTAPLLLYAEAYFELCVIFGDFRLLFRRDISTTFAEEKCGKATLSIACCHAAGVKLWLHYAVYRYIGLGARNFVDVERLA